MKIRSSEDATQRITTEIKKHCGLNVHPVLVPESASPID
jgi:hypothetical protein